MKDFVTFTTIIKEGHDTTSFKDCNLSNDGFCFDGI